MRIAFVSYEYPPETAFGGIATYVEQAALMLAERGHQVEVFAASPTQDSSLEQQGVVVHRVRCVNQLHFYRLIFPVFEQHHKEHAFDVVESPDYKHDGYWIAKKIPDLAHVMRLHSGNHTSMRLFEIPPRHGTLMKGANHFYALLMAFGGAIKRGMPWKDFEGFCDYYKEVWNAGINDRRAAEGCDLIVSPCLDLLRFQARVWNLDPRKLALLPYPYLPNPQLLDIPCGSRGQVVGYFGQMSERKGLQALGEALPLIFRRYPEVRFLFVGKDYGRSDGESFANYLRRQAGVFASQLEFTGQVTLKDMHREYARVDICVFPSIWENFPNVCLEAMCAGRAVAASWSGGMAEMLDTGRFGLLFPPRSPVQLAQAVFCLLENPGLCQELGKRARQRVLNCYGREEIAPFQEALYRQAIDMRRARG